MNEETANYGPMNQLLIDQLEAEVRKASLEESAHLLGHLERIKYLMLTRITMPEPSKRDAAPLSIKDVARRLNVSLSSVYELVRQKKLDSARVGKHIRISEQQLRAYEVTCGLMVLDTSDVPLVQLRHGRSRTQEPAETARAHPSAVGRRTRRDGHDGRAMGTRRTIDQ